MDWLLLFEEQSTDFDRNCEYSGHGLLVSRKWAGAH
jgi:hypothetical protein